MAGSPVPTTWHPLKVAEPEATLAVSPPAFVQLRVPAAGEPLVVARVTVPLNPVTRLPPESTTPTVGDVAKVVVPIALPTGGVVMTSWVAAPVDMVMFDEAADVKPSPVKVRV